MSVIELQSLPEVRIGHLGPMMISVWRSTATATALQAIAAQQRQLLAQYELITTVSVTIRVPQQPAPEAMEWVKRIDEEFRGKSRGTVVVVLERGLAAIIVRSFLAATSLMSQNKMEIVKTVDDACERVKAFAGQVPELVDDAQLADKLDAFIWEQKAAP